VASVEIGWGIDPETSLNQETVNLKTIYGIISADTKIYGTWHARTEFELSFYELLDNKYRRKTGINAALTKRF